MNLRRGSTCIAHENSKHPVRLNRVIDLYLKEGPLLRIHRSLPELLRIHLTKTLVSLDMKILLRGRQNVAEQLISRGNLKLRAIVPDDKRRLVRLAQGAIEFDCPLKLDVGGKLPVNEDHSTVG